MLLFFSSSSSASGQLNIQRVWGEGLLLAWFSYICLQHDKTKPLIGSFIKGVTQGQTEMTIPTLLTVPDTFSSKEIFKSSKYF